LPPSCFLLSRPFSEQPAAISPSAAPRFAAAPLQKSKTLFERDMHGDIANTPLFFAASRTEARIGPEAVKNFVKNFRRSSHRRFFVAERETLAVERTPGLEGHVRSPTPNWAPQFEGSKCHQS
jgi:hypothetical protein